MCTYNILVNSMFMQMWNYLYTFSCICLQFEYGFYVGYVIVYLLSETSVEHRASQKLRRSESNKARLEKLSNNLSERRCERSERASGYITDLLLSERSEVSGKSGIYYIIQVLQKGRKSRPKMSK